MFDRLSESLDDELIPLSVAAALLPRRRAGKKTAVATLYRWCGNGCRGVRLKYTNVGATRCTSRRWLREFFDRLTDVAEGRAALPDGAEGARTPQARERAVARANREAEALGV